MNLMLRKEFTKIYGSLFLGIIIDFILQSSNSSFQKEEGLWLHNPSSLFIASEQPANHLL